MGREGFSRLRKVTAKISCYRVTLLISMFLIGVYAVELFLAGSLNYGAAYTVSGSVSNWLYVVAGPWLHSNHSHIAWNIGMFLILGGWTEYHLGAKSALVLTLVGAYATTVIPPLAGFSRGVGISGMTNMLLPAFVGFQLIDFSQQSVTVFDEIFDLERGGLSKLLPVVKHGSLFLISAPLLLQSAGEAFGLLSRRSGVAIGSHTLGLLLGMIFFAYLAVGSHTAWLE